MVWRGYKQVAVPEHAHPIVTRVFNEMNERCIDTAWLERASGVSASAIKQWRYRHAPRIDNIEAVLNTLGLEIVVQPKSPQRRTTT